MSSAINPMRAFLFNKLERVKANPKEFVLGVCEEDIYLPDEPLCYRSLGRRLGHLNQYRFIRIRQEFYGLPEDESRVYTRLFKQSMHQLAHLFDMTSCQKSPLRQLFFSQNMMDIDNKGEKFCDICRTPVDREKII